MQTSHSWDNTLRTVFSGDWDPHSIPLGIRYLSTMGLTDREYYQEQPAHGFHVGGPRSIVAKLLVINIAFFLLNIFFGGQDRPLNVLLSVSPDVLVKPWLWWKFISYGFAHSPGPGPAVQISHIFCNMLGLWVFGRDIENVKGPREFLRFYLAAMVLSSVFWACKEHFLVGGNRPTYLVGASGAVTAVTLLFVFHYPMRKILLMMVLPVPAWALGVLIVLTNIFYVNSPGSNGEHIAFDVHLVGAAFAICYHRFGWNLGRFLPTVRWPFSLTGGIRQLRTRPKLRVHAPEDDHRNEDVEADRILEKLHQMGEDSLTGSERRILENYSRRMRQKHQ